MITSRPTANCELVIGGQSVKLRDTDGFVHGKQLWLHQGCTDGEARIGLSMCESGFIVFQRVGDKLFEDHFLGSEIDPFNVTEFLAERYQSYPDINTRRFILFREKGAPIVDWDVA